MTAVLQVSTPEGGSGRIFSRGGDYLFRYHESAPAQAAISWKAMSWSNCATALPNL